MGYAVLNLGFDRGNERTNVATISDTGKYIEIDDSSMISEGNLRHYRAVRAGSGTSDTVNRELMVEYEGYTYFVGDFASQGEKPTNGFGDLNRYHSKHTKVSVMGYASLLASRLWPNQNISELAVNLVMGVPIQAYLDEQQQIIDALTGTYRYKFNGRDMVMNIASVRVYMEGAGAAIYYGLDTNASIGVVDSGSFTTNILRFDGMRPYTPECKSFDIGVGHAIQRVNTQFERQYGRDLSSTEQQHILRASIGLLSLPEIYVEGRLVSGVQLQDLMQKALDETGRDRNSRISSLWAKSTLKSFKTVLHVGGGSYYFHNSLATLIKQAQRIDNGERTNARGFATLAQRIASRQAAQRGA